MCRISLRKLLYSSFSNESKQSLAYFRPRLVWQDLHKGYTCARAKTHTFIYLHTMPSNPCQEYLPVPVLSCARSILGKSKLNHTYQNCSNLSHSFTGLWLIHSYDFEVAVYPLTFTISQTAFLYKHEAPHRRLSQAHWWCLRTYTNHLKLSLTALALYLDPSRSFKQSHLVNTSTGSIAFTLTHFTEKGHPSLPRSLPAVEGSQAPREKRSESHHGQEEPWKQIPSPSLYPFTLFPISVP